MKNKILYARCAVLYKIHKGTNPVCDVAWDALTAPGFPTTRGYCQMFVRLVLEKALRRRIWATNPPTAREAALTLRTYKPRVEVNGPLQAGDVLYKEQGSGGAGHCGILFYGAFAVIENSSADVDENGDARGLRTRAAFGRPSFAARIL